MKDQYIVSLRIEKETLENQNTYPFNLPAIQAIDELSFHKNVTFIVGENGSGKSTLLEAIATQYWLNPEWGSKNFHFSTQQTHSILEKYIRLSKWIKRAQDSYFLRAETFYNVASYIDEMDADPSFWPPIKDSYGGKSLHEQSHGESFFSLFHHRLRGDGLYILDEPEAALSPQKQMAFLIRLHELVQKNSQFIIATHSPILLAYPHAKIIELWKDDYTEVSYKESSHYDLYKTFINTPESMIDKLGIKNL